MIFPFYRNKNKTMKCFYQTKAMEIYRHIEDTIATMMGNVILALDTIVAPIRMAFCHHVKPITIRAPDIEDTID